MICAPCHVNGDSFHQQRLQPHTDNAGCNERQSKHRHSQPSECDGSAAAHVLQARRQLVAGFRTRGSWRSSAHIPLQVLKVAANRHAVYQDLCASRAEQGWQSRAGQESRHISHRGLPRTMLTFHEAASLGRQDQAEAQS